eukprot:1195178-Prorocentrum_minimum.AAC.3
MTDQSDTGVTITLFFFSPKLEPNLPSHPFRTNPSPTPLRPSLDPPRTPLGPCLYWHRRTQCDARPQVKEGLLPLLQDIRERGTPPDRGWLVGDYDVKLQAQMCEQIAKDLGFNTDRGRLDVSVSPTNVTKNARM